LLQQREKQAKKDNYTKDIEKEEEIKRRDSEKIEKKDVRDSKELKDLREIEKIKERSSKKSSEKDNSSTNTSLIKDQEHNNISNIENRKICPEDFVAHTVLGKGSFGEV